VYRFKFVNKSRWDATGLRIELDRIRMAPAADGRHVDFKRRLAISTSEILVLPRFRRHDSEGRYAFRVSTRENLVEYLSDSRYKLRLTVYAEHPISGVGRGFRQEFGDITNVQAGSFLFGRRLEVAER
jgi:hypothetical protein